MKSIETTRRIIGTTSKGWEMGLGNALAEYRQALKLEGQEQVLAILTAADSMYQAITEYIISEANK